jgi:hypothetical protein
MSQTIKIFIFYIALASLCLPLVPSPSGGESTGSFLLTHASEKNRLLMDELKWTFGGKNQRGWALYTELIRRTIDSRAEPDSKEFAQALSRWQMKVGLPSDGVLNYNTWMKMVSIFQSNRRAVRESSEGDPQFELIPTSSLYDPQRPEELRRAEKRTLAAYRRMFAAAAIELSLPDQTSEKWLSIISAYRSHSYQAELRRRSPNSGRAGLAINSPHTSGRALDLYVGGEPVSTKDQNRAIQVKTPAYRWLVKNAGRFGFKPYFYEPWHWEYNP